MVLERQIFLQKEGRYPEVIRYCNTFYITQQYLLKLASSSHWGGKLKVPIHPLLVGERSGSVVECLTRDRRVAGSSLTGVTALWSLSKTHLS